MKFVGARPFADPEAAAKLMEIARAVVPVQDGRLDIEKINWPFISEHKGLPTECKAGLNVCIEKGWLELHESGTYVRLAQAGTDLFA